MTGNFMIGSFQFHLSYFTVGFILVTALLLYLALRAGRGYSVEDTQAHAETFGGVVQEGHGGVTAFVAVWTIAILTWATVYLIQHWSQYAVTFFR
jgi:hypothetical protein